MLTSPWQLSVEPRRDVRRLRDEVSRLVESLGQAWPALAPKYPAMNVWQDDGSLYVEVELPGMDLSDLEIYVTGGDRLTLKGERKPLQIENATWHRQERGFGSFVRTLALPTPVDADNVQARLLNGVLTITLPKSAAAKTRKIAVTAE